MRKNNFNEIYQLEIFKYLFLICKNKKKIKEKTLYIYIKRNL